MKSEHANELPSNKDSQNVMFGKQCEIFFYNLIHWKMFALKMFKKGCDHLLPSHAGAVFFFSDRWCQLQGKCVC